jgi:hypothetical protein
MITYAGGVDLEWEHGIQTPGDFTCRTGVTGVDAISPTQLLPCKLLEPEQLPVERTHRQLRLRVRFSGQRALQWQESKHRRRCSPSR